MAAGGVALAVVAYAGSAWWLAAGGLTELQQAGTGGHFTSGPIGDDVLHVGFFGTTPTTSWAWLGIASPHSGAPPDLLHTLGCALAVLGLMLLLEHAVGEALWPLAAIQTGGGTPGKPGSELGGLGAARLVGPAG